MEIPKEYPKTFNFKEFINEVDSPTIVVSAARRAGKSHLTTDIIHQIAPKLKPEVVVLFSETSHLSGDFEFVPKMFNFDHYDEAILNEFVETQAQMISVLKKKGKSKKDFPKLLIIFDDVISDMKAFYSHGLNRLFTTGRHLNISFVFITQYLHALSPKQRGNIDLLILFKDPNFKNNKSVRENFITLNYPKNDINDYVKLATEEKHRAMVLTLYKFQSVSRLDEYIFTYKSGPQLPKFKLGNKVYWKEQDKEEKTKKIDKDIKPKQSKKKHSLDLTKEEIKEIKKKEKS